MSHTHSPWHSAEEYLSLADATMAAWIAQYGSCPIQPRSDDFAALCESIVSQQLAAKAADAIYKRFTNFYGGKPTPAAVAATDFADLRALGLSGQKATYILDLADKLISGQIVPEHFPDMPDREIIKQLTAVKGVGVWTVQMFLIFSLNRQDVFPVDDLGLKKAMQRMHGLDKLPDKKQMEALSAPWAPYRSLASWYLWRSLENK